MWGKEDWFLPKWPQLKDNIIILLKITLKVSEYFGCLCMKIWYLLERFIKSANLSPEGQDERLQGMASMEELPSMEQ